MGYFVKNSVTGVEGLIVPDDDRPFTPLKALLRYNNDTNALEYYNGSVFVELAKVGSTGQTLDTYTGDGTIVEFTGMSFEPNAPVDIVVFVNGILQDPVTAYSVSGTAITFVEAPPINVPISIIHNLGTTYVTDANVFDVPNL